MLLGISYIGPSFIVFIAYRTSLTSTIVTLVPLIHDTMCTSVNMVSCIRLSFWLHAKVCSSTARRRVTQKLCGSLYLMHACNYSAYPCHVIQYGRTVIKKYTGEINWRITSPRTKKKDKTPGLLYWLWATSLEYSSGDTRPWRFFQRIALAKLSWWVVVYELSDSPE